MAWQKTPPRKPNAAFLKPVQPDDKLAAVVGAKPLPSPEISSSEQKISEVPGVNRYG